MDVYLIILMLVILASLSIYCLKNGTGAGWIRKQTPIPSDVHVSDEEKRILKYSVDPGAHLECQKECQDTDPKFMSVCISTCIQKKWISQNDI